MAEVVEQVRQALLLATSREAVDRCFTLGVAWLRTGDRRFADRAGREMDAVAAFEDWNPTHFLDTAEAAFALSATLSWLRGALDRAVVERVEEALIDKALAPSLLEQFHRSWVTAATNWSQVCHGGLSHAALAVRHRAPDLAETILARAIKNLPLTFAQYEPDGAFVEGGSYWLYGSTAFICLLATLHAAATPAPELFENWAFLRSCDYMQHLMAPSGRFFNYADCREELSASPALFWMARRHNLPFWLSWQESALERVLTGNAPPDRHLPMILGWFDADLFEQSRTAAAATHWVGHGLQPVWTSRQAWNDPEAAFVAVKAGTACAPHAHMDVGSFVYECGGVRWAVDLGMPDYHAIESAGLNLWSRGPGAQRWELPAPGIATHNTISLDNRPHEVFGSAPIIDHGPQHALLDMTDVLGHGLKSATRSFALSPDGSLEVVDDLAGCSHGFVWSLLTAAQVTSISGSTVCLSQNHRSLAITVRGEHPGHWSATPLQEAPGVNTNGLSILRWRAGPCQDLRCQIRVTLRLTSPPRTE